MYIFKIYVYIYNIYTCILGFYHKITQLRVLTTREIYMTQNTISAVTWGTVLEHIVAYAFYSKKSSSVTLVPEQ